MQDIIFLTACAYRQVLKISKRVIRSRTFNTVDKRKWTKVQTMICNILYIQSYNYNDRTTRTPHNTGGLFRSCGRVNTFCPTNDTSSDMEIMLDTSKYK